MPRASPRPLITSPTPRNFHLNCLVRVSGVVTRRTGVFPQLRLVKYDCLRCGAVLGPFAVNAEHEVKPSQCPGCSSKGPFTVRGGSAGAGRGSGGEGVCRAAGTAGHRDCHGAGAAAGARARECVCVRARAESWGLCACFGLYCHTAATVTTGCLTTHWCHTPT